MNKKIFVISLLIVFVLSSISFAPSFEGKKVVNEIVKTDQTVLYKSNNDYGLQWKMNFGDDWRYGARYEGPQPTGDCNNDGDIELLIGGRDAKLRVFEWDDTKQTYLETHNIHGPFYPQSDTDPGGFAIGDVTGDGENEIAGTWSAGLHKWKNGKYQLIGFNSYVFNHGGGAADCLIGDCDNDGKNELILTGGPIFDPSDVAEVVVFKWIGAALVKVAEWNDPDGQGYVYMPSIGDVDDDGENELVVGSRYKFVVLDWNKLTRKFETTILKETHGRDYPFATICKDSDNDGKLEIHTGYWSPKITIFEWTDSGYEEKFETEWPNEGTLIEGLDVGDVDDDGFPEVCAGTDVVHILQWNGETYVEEAVLPTWGHLAVVVVGDFDNDGKNEINAGSVMLFEDHDMDYMSWIYKYGWNTEYNDVNMENGSLTVNVESSGEGLIGGSVAAWNLESGTWYDIQPSNPEIGRYERDNELPEGEYLLRAVFEGYKSQETSITITAGEETSYTFSLQEKSRDINEPFIRLIQKIINNFPFFQKIAQRLNLI
jgi:hypothetical protein